MNSEIQLKRPRQHDFNEIDSRKNASRNEKATNYARKRRNPSATMMITDGVIHTLAGSEMESLCHQLPEYSHDIEKGEEKKVDADKQGVKACHKELTTIEDKASLVLVNDGLEQRQRNIQKAKNGDNWCSRQEDESLPSLLSRQDEIDNNDNKGQGFVFEELNESVFDLDDNLPDRCKITGHTNKQLNVKEKAKEKSLSGKKRALNIKNNNSAKINGTALLNGKKPSNELGNRRKSDNSKNGDSRMKKGEAGFACVDNSSNDNRKTATATAISMSTTTTTSTATSTSTSTASIKRNNELTMSENLREKQSLTMKRVKRIDVHERNAKETVTECRQNGIPIVLVGHKGWVNFARPWLKRVSRFNNSEINTSISPKARKHEDIDLDNQNYKYELDIDGMVAHIGEDMAPIVERNYDESKPISRNIKVSSFLKNHWKQDQDVDEKETSNIYLHQWQFPLSKTAGPKLCHQSKLLPQSILGDDMLKYYTDDHMRHCRGDNPWQYVFMGKKGTMSKLHEDPGGLGITIAVITGLKECVLVHRDDGAKCFYDLDAKLDDVDLDKYPLMTQARIWKTTIRPGEILLMPQGTYHQCYNTTNCLSYSRFILDPVNLLPFYNSFLKGDAKELDHDKVMWNCAIEVIKKIDAYSDKVMKCVKNGRKGPALGSDMKKYVEALQCLRHFFRELANSQKGSFKGSGLAKNTSLKRNENLYHVMVKEVDETLRSFQYRDLL